MSNNIYKGYNSSNVEYLRTLISICLEKLGEQTGINFNVEIKEFDVNHFDISVNHTIGCKRNKSAGSTINKAAISSLNANWKYCNEILDTYPKEEYTAYCRRYNLPEEIFGAVVNIKGKNYGVCSIATRNRTYPIICCELSGTYDSGFKIIPDRKIKTSVLAIERNLGLR